jgi:hypothetical protein
LGKARSKLLKARELFSKIGDQPSLAMITGDLAELDFLVGDFISARKGYILAADAAKEFGNEELLVETGIRSLKLDFYEAGVGTGSVDRLMESARKIGAAELQIKISLLKLAVCISDGRSAEAENIYMNLKAGVEIEKFPELSLELFKLNVIRLAGTSPPAVLSKKLIEGIRLSSEKNYILSTIDFYLLAQKLRSICPVKLESKVKKTLTYIKDDMGETEYVKFMQFANLRTILPFNHLRRTKNSDSIPASVH